LIDSTGSLGKPAGKLLAAVLRHGEGVDADDAHDPYHRSLWMTKRPGKRTDKTNERLPALALPLGTVSSLAAADIRQTPELIKRVVNLHIGVGCGIALAGHLPQLSSSGPKASRATPLM
jgi:hypothetical protein